MNFLSIMNESDFASAAASAAGSELGVAGGGALGFNTQLLHSNEYQLS